MWELKSAPNFSTHIFQMWLTCLNDPTSPLCVNFVHYIQISYIIYKGIKTKSEQNFYFHVDLLQLHIFVVSPHVWVSFVQIHRLPKTICKPSNAEGFNFIPCQIFPTKYVWGDQNRCFTAEKWDLNTWTYKGVHQDRLVRCWINVKFYKITLSAIKPYILSFYIETYLDFQIWVLQSTLLVPSLLILWFWSIS